MKRIVIGGLVATAVISAGFALWLFLPDVDNQLGWLNGRGLKLIQDYEQDGIPVRELVTSQFKNVRWRSYHRDHLFETYVRCDGVTVKNDPVAMVWIVMILPERSGWVLRLRTVATAHTQSAFNVAPSLYDQGHHIYRSPDYANW
jgi:hypothetical protein